MSLAPPHFFQFGFPGQEQIVVVSGGIPVNEGWDAAWKAQRGMLYTKETNSIILFMNYGTLFTTSHKYKRPAWSSLTAFQTLVEAVALRRVALHAQAQTRICHLAQEGPSADVHAERGALEHSARKGRVASLVQRALKLLPVTAATLVGESVATKRYVVFPL